MKNIRKIRDFYENHKFFCGVIAGEALMVGAIIYSNRNPKLTEHLMTLDESTFDAIANGEHVLTQVGSSLVWIAKEIHLPE